VVVPVPSRPGDHVLNAADGSVHHIVEVDHRDPWVASAIVRLQRDAYAVEAELAGSDRIPPLHEDAPDVRVLDLRFLAIREGGRIVAAIGFRVEGRTLNIDRLMVDPTAFRQGMGRQLVTAVLEETSHEWAVVSTARDNAPARTLYEKLGFRHLEDVEVAPGLVVAHYERHHEITPGASRCSSRCRSSSAISEWPVASVTAVHREGSTRE
jgi:GNAT superfamily N-acetyltransferase